MDTKAGPVPRVSGRLSRADRLGAVKVRAGIGRMHYTVEPGLYALGQPGSDSPVLVTANYKLSFDKLRCAFACRSAWILVLDTKGINVWCAAGKGTFGTSELVFRVTSSGLEKVVSHRRLILPQLSAPGVSAHQVKRESGFSVIYGPVRADDLPDFMDSGMRADRRMRVKEFPLLERAVLIPMEFIPALKWTAVLLLFFFIGGGWGFDGGFRQNLANHGMPAALVMAGGLLGGSVITPLLLPWLPGRAFAAKGALAGLAVSALILTAWKFSAAVNPNPAVFAESAALVLVSAAFSSYLGMNFTGASTYTSLSGVRREMRLAVPAQLVGAAAGLLLWGIARFM